jgi:hypothetical protein
LKCYLGIDKHSLRSEMVLSFDLIISSSFYRTIS